MKEFDIKKVKENWDKAQRGRLVCTKEGYPVKILTLSAHLLTDVGSYSVIGLVEKPDGQDLMCWGEDGFCSYGSQNNLKLQSQKRSGWVNVYRQPNDHLTLGLIRDTKEIAESMCGMSGSNYVRTMYVEWEE
jgi:hypothetical protein